MAGTHRVDAERVGSQKDAGDVGVQGEQRVLGQERVTVATAGRVFRGAGTRGGRFPGDGGAGRRALPPARLVGHGSHAPARGEDNSGAAEALVVDEAGVDREQAHEQEHVAATEKGLPDLGVAVMRGCPDPPHPTRQAPTRLTSFCAFFTAGRSSASTMARAKRNMSSPWPTSPNITAKRKGKVMMV